MKKKLLFITILTAINLGVFAQNVTIPDANFKAYLVGNTNINTNGDAEIQISEANAFTGRIDCNNKGINDLTGIEAFVNLTNLICRDNKLSSLDISHNTALTNLNCQSNNLTSLDVTQNTLLIGLNCSKNNIDTLNLNQNQSLELLVCGENNLTVLDVSQLTALVVFSCNQNNIEILDFSQNIGMNQNTSLQIPSINCSQNNLSVLKLNGISTKSIQGKYFNATSNPNLSCIEVDDVAAATSTWTNIDATASFSTDCNYPAPIVNIPDANFKAYLVGNTNINTNGDAEIQVSEANAFTGSINCSSQNISSLTGIEAFVNLTELHCELNNLSSLDISQNTALTVLHLNKNGKLNTLDLSHNIALTSLRCGYNSMSNLNLSQNINLESLQCYNNSLTNLDLSQNTALTYLMCQNNSLTSLNVANGNNTEFIMFNASNNPNLTCIEVDDVNYSTTNWTNIDATASFNLNCNPLSINESELAQKISIYPNPVVSQIHINSEEIIESIEITNSIGKTIKIFKTSMSNIDISDFRNGIYFLKIQTDKGLLSKKFIKK